MPASTTAPAPVASPSNPPPAKQPAKRPRTANQHGRKPGRGLRPWLLIPKLLCVCGLLGGLTSSLLLMVNAAPNPHTLAAVHGLIMGLLVPSAALAYVLGVALMLQHPDVLPTKRWVLAKIALATVGLPGVHGLAAWQARQLEKLFAHGTADASALARHWHLLMLFLCMGWLLTFALLWLGRHKPRLGAHPRPRPRPRKQSPEGASAKTKPSVSTD